MPARFAQTLPFIKTFLSGRVALALAAMTALIAVLVLGNQLTAAHRSPQIPLELVAVASASQLTNASPVKRGDDNSTLEAVKRMISNESADETDFDRVPARSAPAHRRLAAVLAGGAREAELAERGLMAQFKRLRHVTNT